jgi:hypothetical protein
LAAAVAAPAFLAFKTYRHLVGRQDQEEAEDSSQPSSLR